jgi:hypothetical protein
LNQYVLGQSASLATAFSNGAKPVGQKATIAATGQDIIFTGNLIDPVTVTLKVQDGAGTLTTYTYGVGPTIVRDSVGLYYALLPLTVVGNWLYAFEGDPTTNVAKLGFNTFTVVAAPF